MPADELRPLLPRLRDLVAPADAHTPDRELLRRFSAGRDEAAFAEIVRRHGPMLQRVCRRSLGQGSDAEDVCQATFLLLARKADSVRWQDSVAGWLYQTAYRLSQKARVAAGRRARHEARARLGVHPDPVTELTARELHAALDEEVNLLPEQYRAPILLCCLEGRSRDEAAVCLGWHLATVKDRLERGRERLRTRLARRGVVLGTALTSAWLGEGTARAALSPHATAHHALLIASGQADIAGLLPPYVAALTKGMTMTMALSRMTILAGCLALALGAATALTNPTDGTEGPPARAPDKAAAKPATAEAGPVQPQSMTLVGHNGAVNAVAFSPDGRRVATAGADKSVRVWDVATGALLRRLDQPDAATAVAFSPDGATLVAGSPGNAGALILWDPAVGRALWRVAGGAGAVAFSPDGTQVAAGMDVRNAVSVVDARTGKIFFAFVGGGRVPMTAVAFSPDGKSLVAGDEGGGINLLDGQTGRALATWGYKNPAKALVFLPGKPRVATPNGGNSLRLLDSATGKEETSFTGKEVVRALAVSADGRRLVTAGASGTIVLWDLSGKPERQFAASGAVNVVACSPDGRWLAAAGANGVFVYDLTRDEMPLPQGFKLSEADLKTAWADLASDQAGMAYAAARRLRADPAKAVPFLQERLKAKPASVDQKKLGQLVVELDSDEFAKREAATKELERFGWAAEPALRGAMAGKPSPEAKARLQRLLAPLDREGKELRAEQRRDVRAVLMLEQAGTAEAKKLLEALSKESAGWWVGQEAKAALARLGLREKRP